IASCEGHLDHGTYAPYIDVQNQRACELVRNHMRDGVELSKNLIKQIELLNLAERERISGLLEAFYTERSINYDSHLIIRPLALGWSRLESQGVDMQRIRPNKQRKA